MAIGVVTACIALYVAADQVLSAHGHDPTRQVFLVVGGGLATAAAIELAYTLFTAGPDEALDPVMLGLSAALILQLGKAKSFRLGSRRCGQSLRGLAGRFIRCSKVSQSRPEA
jgi:hypothetical protein